MIGDPAPTRPRSTALPWSQGRTLLTRQTVHWSPGEIKANDLIEAVNVFAFFSEADDGRGRERVCQCFGPLAAANAAFIVECVNARAANRDLREALREAYEYFDQRADITDAGAPNECAHLRETLRAALERAGEGEGEL